MSHPVDAAPPKDPMTALVDAFGDVVDNPDSSASEVEDARSALLSAVASLRAEYRRVKGVLQCLDLGASNRNAYVEHAMLCDARFSPAPCECGYAEVEAIQRECSACSNQAVEDGLCDPCHGFSPSTPETKDDHR